METEKTTLDEIVGVTKDCIHFVSGGDGRRNLTGKPMVGTCRSVHSEVYEGGTCWLYRIGKIGKPPKCFEDSYGKSTQDS